jgi:hypothetical protein
MVISWCTCNHLATNPLFPLLSPSIIRILPPCHLLRFHLSRYITTITELSQDPDNSWQHPSDNNGKRFAFTALLTVHFYWCLIAASSYIKRVGLQKIVETPPPVTDVIVASILCLWTLWIMVDACNGGSIYEYLNVGHLNLHYGMICKNSISWLLLFHNVAALVAYSSRHSVLWKAWMELNTNRRCHVHPSVCPSLCTPHISNPKPLDKF